MSNLNVAALRSLVRDTPAGGTLLVAADVYAALMESRNTEAIEVLAQFRGVEIRRQDSLKPGTAMIMARADIAAPSGSWAAEFLHKAGPVHRDRYGSAVQFVEPPAPPEPPMPPPRPRTRERHVDS